jgi:hypothetical protein
MLIGYGRRRMPEIILTVRRRRNNQSKSNLSFNI